MGFSQASTTQALSTREEFLSLRAEGDDEYGLPVREEETHALLALHKQLVENDGDDELREFVEDELKFRAKENGPKMPPNDTGLDWAWQDYLAEA